MRTIRTASLRDLELLARAESLCFPPAEAAGKERILERLRVYPQHFWMLFEDGQLCSYINGMVTDREELTDELFADASLHDEQGAYQMLFGVATLPAFRGRGLAGTLMQHVIGQAAAQGRRGLILTCKERLLPFYARFGFENEGVSPSEHGGAQWYQMRLALKEPTARP